EVKRHAWAARKLLRALVPTESADVANNRCSEADLREVAGYGDRPEDFAALLAILDEELRLVCALPGQGLGAAPYWRLAGDGLVAGVARWVRQADKAVRRKRGAGDLPPLVDWNEGRQRLALFSPLARRRVERAGCGLLLLGVVVTVLIGIPLF